MAPIAPVSRKRSTPSQSDDDMTDEPMSKRIRTEPALPHTPPPEEETPTMGEKIALFDDGPRQLMMRSVALTLEHVGFSGASPEAVEAICAEAETYALEFLSQITSSMLNARRSLPTPLDFQYALKQFSLPLASLEPHLKPPIPPSKLHIQLEISPSEEVSSRPVARLFGDGLSGEPDKNAKTYIPKRFPSFPSKHTYKWTEKDSERETDARKIREEASVQARQGEDALRRLTTVGKAGKEKGVKQTAGKDPKSKQRHELWEQTMGGLLAAKHIHVQAAAEEVDRSMIVNANKSYHRKGAVAKRKPPPQLPPDLFTT